MNITLFRPFYNEREIENVRLALQSGWSGLGPMVEKFEIEFAKHLGVKFSVMTNSCTAALELAIRIKRVRMAVVPAMTFIATARAAQNAGADVRLADIDPDTLLGNYRSSYDHEWVIHVLLAGQPCDGGNPKVIYDCAHAVGSDFDARGKLCCWSFHAVKNLAMGEGGCLTTDDPDVAAQARKLRWLGIDKSTHERSKGPGYSWEYDVGPQGYKAHGNDVAAAIGLAQLEKLPDMQRHRATLWCRYRQLPGFIEWLPGHSSLLAVIRHKRRDELAAHLRAKGIATGVHYKPLSQFVGFNGCPIADRLWTELLTLPLFPTMTLEMQDEVIAAIKEFGA